MSLALTPDQPWLGLASYEEAHRPYFFGRRAEEDDLFERVRRHRLTVLYGPSGLGKTSLLRAGLMPRLVTADWLPVRVRLTYPERLDTIVEADPQSLLQQVLESLSAALVAAEHPAGEKLRTALAPSPGLAAALPSLWELWHDTAWGLRETGAPRPVLLVDQFEEIFTLGEDEARARSAARVLRDALADLIEDRPPPALDRRLQEDPALSERFDFTPDAARVVLVLREDYLSRLERWKKLLPSLLRNRLELRLLDGPRALEAVTGPARAGRAVGDGGLVPDNVAAAIVRAVSDVPEDTPIEDIEAVPPLLSLLCKELNEKRRAASPAAAQIDLALVRENRSAILQRFYEECFDGFPPAVRLVMEDHLLSPGGYRENPGYDTLVSALTARSVPEPALVLAALVERRLITAEDRGGRRRVELTHDVLAPIVKRSLDERREREAAEEAQRKLAEESAKARRRRVLVGVMAVLTVLAAAGALFGWHKAGEAKSEAVRAENNLSKALVEIDRSTLEEGKAWIERARTAKEQGDHFTAIMLAGRAVGFRGYGAERYVRQKAERFKPLLGLPLEHNKEAEAERLIELEDARKLIRITGPSLVPIFVGQHSQTVWSVAFSPDGTRLASGSHDHLVKLWDIATGEEVTTLAGHSATVRSVAFSPDGTRLASGSGDHTVKLWGIATGKEVTTLSGHSAMVRSVAFSPDGTRLASGADDGVLKLWDTTTGQEIITLAGHSVEVSCVAFSPDGTRLASGAWDRTVKLWDTVTGDEITTLSGHSGGVNSVAFSPDGTWLASASSDKTVKLWDAVSFKVIATLAGHLQEISSIAFSPDGMRLASGSDDGSMKLWDMATGNQIASLPPKQSEVNSVAFSPDGTRLASGSSDHTVKLWDAATSDEVRTLSGHSDMVRSVAFSPDGKWLASGSRDKSVKLWDTATGREFATFSGHSYDVDSVAFSPDGTRLASGQSNKTVKLWDLTTGRELPGQLDFPLINSARGDERWTTQVAISVIRILPVNPPMPDLMGLMRQGLFRMEGRGIVWNDHPQSFFAEHYRQDELALLGNPMRKPEERAVLRLQMCAKARQWRAALALWRQLVVETPALINSAPARRELLFLAATTLYQPIRASPPPVKNRRVVVIEPAKPLAQQLAQAQRPTAPAELCTAITENLRAEDFTDLRISLALSQAAEAVLAMDAVFTPPLPADVREAFRAHLLKTAPQPWREAVLDTK